MLFLLTDTRVVSQIIRCPLVDKFFSKALEAICYSDPAFSPNFWGTDKPWNNYFWRQLAAPVYSFAAFDLRQRIGVAILSNWVEGVEDLGASLLDPGDEE